MARSFRWLSLLCASSYFLSGCSLLPFSVEIVDKRATEGTEVEGDKPSEVDDSAEVDVESEQSESPVASPVADTSETPAETPTETPEAPQTDFFREGVNRAESAVAIGQSAQSTDDWTLAASRWKQAVSYMEQVPASDPNYSTAQQKVKEYQQHQTLAERRAAGEKPAQAQASNNRPNGLVASIPISDQMSGIPVVPVTLVGNQGSHQTTMLFDTGASSTLITPAMANAIGVVIVDTAIVTVADGRQVEIPIGFVDTLQVGDLVVRDIVVGIGGDVGLLGQDVYGQYGISIGTARIDLYE